jgi:hypothetical protein
MKNERDELSEKLEKLNRFRSQNFHMLDKTEWYLMKSQQNVMQEYVDILNARIAHAVLKEQSKRHSLIG